MRSRVACALGASILLALACSGGAFSNATDGSSGSGFSSSSGSSGEATGGKAQAGSSSKAGSSGKAGSGTGGGAMGGTSSGGSSGTVGGVTGVSGTDPGEAGAPTMSGGCTGIDQCPAAASKCKVATCELGECGEEPVADGPFKLQVAGDCQTLQCVGGIEKIIVDVNDKNDDNECTTDSCNQNGVPTHKANFAQICNNGAGTCNAQGQCNNCSRDNCPPANGECTAPICVNGTCQLAPRPAGSFCQVTVFDVNQCDGAGNCFECVDSGGCGECCVCNAQHVCQEA